MPPEVRDGISSGAEPGWAADAGGNGGGGGPSCRVRAGVCGIVRRWSACPRSRTLAGVHVAGRGTILARVCRHLPPWDRAGSGRRGGPCKHRGPAARGAFFRADAADSGDARSRVCLPGGVCRAVAGNGAGGRGGREGCGRSQGMAAIRQPGAASAGPRHFSSRGEQAHSRQAVCLHGDLHAPAFGAGQSGAPAAGAGA